MDSSLRWETNDNLYGPYRISANTAIKNVLIKDHVLQEGEWDAEATRQDPWSTTTSNNFKKPLPVLSDHGRKAKSVGRHVSNLIFGTSSGCRLPTTVRDFERKWLDTPKKAQPDLGTSIPDFATKYQFNKKIGKDGSIYSNSYNETKKLDTSDNTKERKQLTKDLRTTHFHLGNTQNNYDTETTHKFQPSGTSPDSLPSVSANAALETYRSNVFRDGDWNVSGHPSVRYSVTRNDFHMKPFTAGFTDRVNRCKLRRSRAIEEESMVIPLGEQINRAIMSKLVDQRELSSIISQAFLKYDKDRSGYITKEQFKSVICEYRPSTTDDEVDSLIKKSRSGKLDGKIDYNTFVTYIDSFSGSVGVENPLKSIQHETYNGTHVIKTCYPDTSVHPKDDPSHPYYQISTHFQLGNHCDEPTSVYYKDYIAKDPWFKPLQALPPMSSQVLPESNGVNVLKSTKQADFVDHAYEGKVITQAREREMKKNQKRLAKQSIELATDPMTAQAYRQTSVSGTDFPSPPSEFRPITPRHAPLCLYRHLETNNALLVPPRDTYLSENQDKFKSQEPLTMFKEKKVECLERTGDNRNSHFTLGADSEPKGSEQHHQFFQKTPLDSSVPAAGKKQTAGQNYSHVYPSESAEKGVVQTPRDDVSVIQNRLKEMNKMRYSIPRNPSNIDVRKAFLEFDKNLSGKISKEDFQTACNNLHIYFPSEELSMLYEGCSKDKQGNIDYLQFVKGFTEKLALTKGRKPNMTSVMKSDYCPPEERSFSSAQKRTIEVARTKPFTTMSSHYFHYDNPKEKTKITTTSHDFSRPDRLGSEPRSLSVF